MEIKNVLSEIQVKYTHHVPMKDRVQVRDSDDVFNVLWTIWDKDLIAYQEAFVVLFLNRANRILGYRWVSFGGLASTVVDVRYIFAIALKCGAHAILLAHNHPSCNKSPSEADLAITDKIKAGGVLLDIKVLDHLIITPEKTYYSFANEGVL